MEILKLLTKNRIAGNIGEKAAAKYLRRKGYRIIEKNFVGGGHEIDLIVKNKEFLAFVEVKSRNLTGIGKVESRPAASVTPQKQRKIISAARNYRPSQSLRLKKRFDIVEVYLDCSGRLPKPIEIKHLENTFDLNTAYGNNNQY